MHRASEHTATHHCRSLEYVAGTTQKAEWLIYWPYRPSPEDTARQAQRIVSGRASPPGEHPRMPHWAHEASVPPAPAKVAERESSCARHVRSPPSWRSSSTTASEFNALTIAIGRAGRNMSSPMYDLKGRYVGAVGPNGASNTAPPPTRRSCDRARWPPLQMHALSAPSGCRSRCTRSVPPQAAARKLAASLWVADKAGQRAT
ncbi:hypothetical protein PYCCODRAFT_690385 [Trametes coccinea BRFM310]|uniref:Uncharacterized protein n=1 Tax=Trametes coccinea (strain BRFM310) TaxID=1353009 RepID=A0A1Y2IH67_TRAC3|nr:hypothetical protein PYCCODRAFT_690385 [Trametes coccinea BRFM310]